MDLEKLIIGNAAGTARTIEDVRRLEDTAVTRITVGSITKHPRDGNVSIPGRHVYYFDPKTQTSVNSLGMPNRGIEHYRRGVFGEMKKIAHDHGKELWVSVAGFNPDEFLELALSCAEADVDGIELNFGCPNIKDGGVTHAVISHNPELCDEILLRIESAFAMQGKEIGLKISPASNHSLHDLSEVINRYISVREITAINTLPEQHLLLEDGTEALGYIPPNSSEVRHTGGLGGKALTKDAIRTLKVMRATFLSSMRVNSTGGIFTGRDVKERLDAKASGFMCATAYLEYGPKIFSTIVQELVELQYA
jgi:dihydroorotate dehydrogenase (fumarate)